MRRGRPGMAELSERAIEREGRRLLPRLARDAGRIERLHGEAAGSQGAFGVFTRRNGYGRPVERLAAEVVTALARRQWLEREGEHWRLSDAGRAWLLRQAAPGDPFQVQHQVRGERTVEVAPGIVRSLTVNEAENPLAWLRRRKGRDGAPMVSEEQYRAGERLRADFWRGHMTPRVTANWSAAAPSRRTRRSGGEGGHELGEDALAARQRVRAALQAVGPELAGVLVDVCCHLSPLAAAEDARGWPRRSGKVILQLALSALARHYGIAPRRPATASARLRHWGAQDYRPTLEDWR